MGGRKEFVVYLSSTLADLGPERELALKTIAEVGVVKTSYRADEKGAVAACTGDVRASSLYVGILGQRYGYIPADDNPQGKSITELEYESCVRPGEPPIPRLIFIKPTEAGIAAQHIDAIANPATAERMKAFLLRANTDQIGYIMQGLDDFRAELRIRVREKADAFHRENAAGGGMLSGGKSWQRRLRPVAIGCVPGSDEDRRAAIAAASADRFVPFELSPNDPAYLATLDAAVATAQLGALLVSADSLARLATDDARRAVAAAIAMLVRRTGRAVIIAAGVARAGLPAEWAEATVVELAADAFAPAHTAATLDDLYDRLRAFEPGLTRSPRLALPYVVIAPTLAEVESLTDASASALGGFQDLMRALRKAQLDRIANASRAFDPAWPANRYGATRHAWRCFGPALVTADELVRESVRRMNAAPDGSRERRFLQTAQLVPRRYSLDEYLDDSLGSRQAFDSVREAGCLFLVDELALLHPRLREAADRVLVGSRSAIVAISPCDPAHSRIDDLLGDGSYLRVGSLVARFTAELDPRCEIALNSLGRMERWLRNTLPELVAGAEEAESDPALVARAAQLLA